MPPTPSSELILANLGTPAAPTPAAVRAFLAEFLGDPLVVEKPRWFWLPILHGIVLRVRPKKVAKAYAEIWSDAGSPLAAGTAALAHAVAAARPDLRVSHCYRYGSPNLAERLAASSAAHPGSDHPIRVVPLFPQRTASSSGTMEALTAELAKRHGLEGRLTVASLSPTAEGYVAALADSTRRALDEMDELGGDPHLLVSFHGIPQYVDDKEGSRYSQDCRATFDALLAALDLPPERATLAFQSRFGFDPWIGPATDDMLVELAESGRRRVVVATPGFLTAGLETIEELGIRGREDFMEAGGEAFALAPPPVETTPTGPRPHPRFVEALTALADG